MHQVGNWLRLYRKCTKIRRRALAKRISRRPFKKKTRIRSQIVKKGKLGEVLL
jgi:hypothetical protein